MIGDGARFSGPTRDYQEPGNGPLAILHLETEKKTDGFGLEPYPHTAIIYEQCSTGKDEKVKFGYLGDLKISVKSERGNPALVKVSSGKPIFLAFGLINPINQYECTSKYIFTPEKDKTYSFINSLGWSECASKTGILSDVANDSPIENIKTLDKAKKEELLQAGVNMSREPC
jgi:hypothetical protein